jgi:uncharacterized protein YkuJ
MNAYINAIKELRQNSNSITIIDIGCARCAFINELLINYFDKINIKSIGIDPLKHNGIYNAENCYNTYIQGCVDNIPIGTTIEKIFYINDDDQASSLLKINTQLFSSDLNSRDNYFYYPQNIIDRLNKPKKEITVKVYNLCNIIDKYFEPDTIIDFIKIDAEGKDCDIAISLKPYLNRIKYISLECSSHNNKNLRVFENGSNNIDAMSFFKENNFDIFEITDYSKDINNLAQVSDIIFKNNAL